MLLVHSIDNNTFFRSEIDDDVLTEREVALADYGQTSSADGSVMVVNNMSKRFGRKFMAVKGLSFTVKQGQHSILPPLINI